MSTHMPIAVIFYTITRLIPCIIVSANRREQLLRKNLCCGCEHFCTHIPKPLPKPKFATHCASGHVDILVLLFKKHIKAYSSYIYA